MLFVEYFNIRPTIAVIFSFLIGISINYIISYLWVYNTLDGKSLYKTYSVFLLLALFIILYNSAVMYFGNEVLHVHYLICKVFASASAAMFNFITRKFLFEKFCVIFKFVKI